MAQKVTVQLVDDVDGTEAAETVTFGLDGTTYEIDLSNHNAKKFRQGLERFVEAARKTSGRRGKRALALATTPTVTATVPKGPKPSVVRAWAKENGIEVGNQGRVARSIVQQYEEAMAQAEEQSA